MEKYLVDAFENAVFLPSICFNKVRILHTRQANLFIPSLSEWNLTRPHLFCTVMQIILTFFNLSTQSNQWTYFREGTFSQRRLSNSQRVIESPFSNLQPNRTKLYLRRSLRNSREFQSTWYAYHHLILIAISDLKLS